MRKHMLAAFVILLFVLAGCGNTQTPKPTPTHPPVAVSQVCLGSFVQTATIQNGSSAPVTQQMQIQGTCVPSHTLKLGQSETITLPSDSPGISQQMVLQPYLNDFVVHIPDPDPVTLNNCSGNTTLSQSFTLAKTIESGVVLGDTRYATAPTGTQRNTLDQMAQVLFDQDSIKIENVTPGTFVFTITTDAHTRTTEFVTWDEHFIAGRVSLTQGTSVLIESIYAIPSGIRFSSTSTPQTTSC